MTTSTLTPNFAIPVPDRDKRFWHPEYKAGMTIVDAVLAKYIAVNQFQGVWANSTAYTVGMTVVDADTAALYQCAASHTSATSGTFADDRTDNPTFWTDVSFLVRFRGTWMQNTAYNRGDFVVSGHIYALCIDAHTSTVTGTIDDANNVSKWSFLIDATDTVDAINNQLFRTVQVISGAHEITNSDKNNLLIYNGTGDTWTVDPSGLDEAFEVAICNYGNGGIIIDPAGSATIDLLGTFSLDGVSSCILTRQSSSEFRTISKTYLSYTGNTFLAGPASGFGAVTMRALVSADLPALSILSKATSYDITPADTNSLIIATAAVTLSLPALPAIGFQCYVYNAHSAAIIVDTDGAQLINGDASVSIEPEGAGWFIYNGTGFVNMIPAAPTSSAAGDVEIITGNDTLVNADNGKTFICTSNVTLSIGTIGDLDDGWYVDVIRESDHDDFGYVVINPAADIDDLGQVVGYGGERFRIWKRGTVFRTDRRSGLIYFGRSTGGGETTIDLYTDNIFYDDPEIMGAEISAEALSHNSGSNRDFYLLPYVGGAVDGGGTAELRFAHMTAYTTPAGTQNLSTNQLNFAPSQGNGASITAFFKVNLGKTGASGMYCLFSYMVALASGTAPYTGTAFYINGPIEGFQFALNSTGQFDAGNIVWYGIRGKAT